MFKYMMKMVRNNYPVTPNPSKMFVILLLRSLTLEQFCDMVVTKAWYVAEIMRIAVLINSC